jgi:peptidoglycan/xylan/chitin deacetylase (PgdA/CDA1 family)
VPRVALTFDDGPGLVTAELLDVLRDASWPATFFVLGRNVDEAPWCGGDVARARGLVQRALTEGHVVAHHTYSHAKPEDYRNFAPDFRHGEEVVRACRKAAGWDGAAIAAPVAFRLPYGVRLVERTVRVETGTLNVATVDPRLPVLASLGRTHVHWTADFADWAAKPGEGAEIASRMLAHVDENARRTATSAAPPSTRCATSCMPRGDAAASRSPSRSADAGGRGVYVRPWDTPCACAHAYARHSRA